MRVWAIQVPPELATVFSAIALSDDGSIMVRFVDDRVLRQISVGDGSFGDLLTMPVMLHEKTFYVHTSPRPEPSTHPSWRQLIGRAARGPSGDGT